MTKIVIVHSPRSGWYQPLFAPLLLVLIPGVTGYWLAAGEQAVRRAAPAAASVEVVPATTAAQMPGDRPARATGIATR